MKMEWDLLYAGKIHPDEVQEAIKDPEWQELRKDLKGTSLITKYCALIGYSNMKSLELVAKYRLKDYDDKEMEKYHHELRMLEVRITNYVTALSRGGLLKPEDYR